MQLEPKLAPVGGGIVAHLTIELGCLMAPDTLQAAAAHLCVRGWFAGQPASLQQIILHRAILLKVPAGKIIYRQGDPPTGLFGICSGRVKFSYTLQSGKEIVAGFGASGMWFGEVSMIDGLPRHHAATAASATTLVQIPRKQFDEIVTKEPALVRNFATLLCNNLRKVLFFHDEVNSQPPLIRLAQLLSLLAQGDVQPGDKKDIVLEISQSQLASMIGLSRQTTNKLLQHLKERRLIEIQYGAIIVLNARELLRMG